MQRLDGLYIAIKADPQHTRGFARAKCAGLAEFQASLLADRRGSLAHATQGFQTRFGLLAKEGQGNVHERRVGPAIVATRVIRVESAERRLDFLGKLNGEEEAHGDN